MWRRVNAAAWLCDFLTSSSVCLLQQSVIIPISLAGAWSLHLPPVCSAETGPLVRMEGAAALAGMREDVGGFLQKLLQPLVENLKVSETPRPAPPFPSPLSWLLPRLSHVTTDVFSKSLWLWRRKEGAHALFFLNFIFVPEALNGEVARCFQNIPRAPSYTKQ